MTNEERQGLIEHCEFMISEHIKYGGYSDDEQIYRIALASLQAEPVALRDYREGSGGISRKPGFNELPHGTELFTTPPAPAQQWIPCSKQLPDKKQRILVWVDCGRIVPGISKDAEWTGHTFRIGQNTVQPGENGNDDLHVTHWMHLPAAPEPGGDL